MEFSHKLILSLRHDLQILNKTSYKILEKLDSFELKSWLYPTKSFQRATEDILGCSPEKTEYLGYLEFIVDRLHLLLNLISHYLETFPGQKAEKPRNVIRSPNISLGTSVDLLWKQIMQLHDFSITRKKQDTTTPKAVLDQGSQTPDLKNLCSCCDEAVACIKEIFRLINNNQASLYVKETSESLQDDIYELTQLGCMNRLTSAILSDIEIFCLKMKYVKEEGLKLDERIRNLSAKHDETLIIMKALEISLKKTKNRCQSVIFKNKKLQKDNQALSHDSKQTKLKLTEEQSKTEILETSLKETTEKLALLEIENEKLRRELDRSLEENEKNSSEIGLWKDRFSETYLENRELLSKLEAEEENKLLARLGEDCENFLKRLGESEIAIEEKITSLEDLVESLKKQAEQGRNNHTCKSTSEIIEITGDPVADMKKQVEMNNYNIKELELNNMALLKTIRKVQEKLRTNLILDD